MLNCNFHNYYQKPFVTRPAFKGLTSYMERDILVLPHKEAERLVENYPTPHLVVGHFPEDILKIMKSHATSKQDLRRKIKIFNVAMALQAFKINSFEYKTIKKAKTLDIEDYMYRALLKSAENPEDESIGYVKYPIKFALKPEEMEDILNNGSFKYTMKELKVIGKDEKIKFTFEGKGTYKNCFKMEFLDKDGKAIVHPKAFVVGKKEDLGSVCDKIVKDRVENYFSKTSYKDFRTAMKAKINNDNELSDEEKALATKEIKKLYDGKYKTCRIFNGAAVFSEFKDINGIFPEANAALKIRKDLGKDYKRADVITPYIFDLKSKFGLLEFADDDVEKTEVKYDFNEHNLYWIDNKQDNYSKNRHPKIIDYGCMFPKEKEGIYYV